jgi:hypothetical protein
VIPHKEFWYRNPVLSSNKICYIAFIETPEIQEQGIEVLEPRDLAVFPGSADVAKPPGKADLQPLTSYLNQSPDFAGIVTWKLILVWHTKCHTSAHTIRELSFIIALAHLVSRLNIFVVISITDS